MVKSCCAYNCNNEWIPNADIKFHTFPLKNPQRLQLWIQALKRKNFKPSSSSVICSKHFKEDDYLESSANKNILKQSAVPSVFNFPSHMLKCESKRKKLIVHEESYEKPQSFLIINNDEAIKPKFCDVATQTSHLKTQFEVDLRRQLKNIKQKVKRKNIKLQSMKDLVKHLQTNKKGSANIQNIFVENFEGFQLDLFKNEIKNSTKNKTQKRYTDEMKKFALTLNFYSPRAYEFVRSKINLPHSATVRKWLSSVNCEVGFMTEVFEYLKNLVENHDYLKDVSLVFDSMAIRSGIVYDKKSDKHYGYVDLGGIANTNNEELATEVLVFQIVSFTTKFKCPIAYFFVNKISASLQQQFILLAIQKLFEIGINIRSITCDGCATNIKTLTLLGCNLSADIITPYFKNPCNNGRIYCILDACHVLKLLRNAFGEISLSSSKGHISFIYVKKLHQLQDELDLKFANKLSLCHINFEQKKMNVRLAAQTISCSVANAIEFLCKSGHPDFIGSEATVEFIRIFDRIFDVMNSRTVFAKGYKSPLYIKNKHYWSTIFKETKNYILDLKADGNEIVRHRRNTFAIGFLMNMFSLENLAVELLTREKDPLKYFLTYKCSQDHLELYFSCIRSRGGWNDNPNSLQFKWTLRKLLFNNSVQQGVNSNCLDNDFYITPVFESRINTNHIIHNNDRTDSVEALYKLISFIDRTVLTCYQENILYYIAGFIVRKLFKKNCCMHCKQMLLTEMYDNDHDYCVPLKNYASFTKFVNQGKLYFSSRIVFDIVKYSEIVFRAEVNLNYMGKVNFKQRMVMLVMQHFVNKNLTKMFQPSHPIVDMHEDLKFIVTTYANIRIQTHAKKKTDQFLGEKTALRHKLHKTILFYHV